MGARPLKIRCDTHPKHALACTMIAAHRYECSCGMCGAQVESLDGKRNPAHEYDVRACAPTAKARASKKARIAVHRMMKEGRTRLMIVRDPKSVIAGFLHIGRAPKAQRRHCTAPMLRPSIEIRICASMQILKFKAAVTTKSVPCKEFQDALSIHPAMQCERIAPCLFSRDGGRF